MDTKPDNVLVNYHNVGQETIIEQVRITDLENAAHLPKGRCWLEMTISAAQRDISRVNSTNHQIYSPLEPW